MQQIQEIVTIEDSFCSYCTTCTTAEACLNCPCQSHRCSHMYAWEIHPPLLIYIYMHINHKLPSIESCDASCVIAAACLYGRLAKNALKAELCVRV